jgi:hypothetical protein
MDLSDDVKLLPMLISQADAYSNMIYFSNQPNVQHKLM